MAIKKLIVHANFPDLNRWLRERFVTGLNQKYASVQEKLSNTTGLTFEKAVEVAVNMTMVKENARRFHSPGGATGGTVSRAIVNRVRFAPKSGEGRYPKHRDMTGKQQQQASGQQCLRCCGKHAPQACKFKSEQCFRCGKRGHIARSKACKGKPRVRAVTEEAPKGGDNHFGLYSTYTVGALKSTGIRVPVCIEGTNFDMQLDTAADVSFLPENLYRNHLSHLPLKPAGIVLKTYENQTVELVRKILVTVKYEDQQVRNLRLMVTRGKDKAALFGLQWLESIKLNWHKVCCMRVSVAGVLEKHTQVFKEEIVTLKGFAAKIHVDEGKPPKFFKARPVPYAMRKKWSKSWTGWCRQT